MAETVKCAVIDSSVALKQRFRDEEGAEQADALFNDYARGALRLLVPSLFDYEVANVFRTAVLRGRLAEAEAYSALADLNLLQLERHDFVNTQSLALQLAFQYQRSAYDSAYLALAQSQNLCFYTGDQRLYNAVSPALPWVKEIADYSLTDIL